MGVEECIVVGQHQRMATSRAACALTQALSQSPLPCPLPSLPFAGVAWTVAVQAWCGFEDVH